MAKPLAVLRLVLQREGHGDCAIATLATYLGKSYEDVLVAAARITKRNVVAGGLHGTEIERAAKHLACPLRRVSWEDVDEDVDTGLLYVKGRFYGEKYEEHVVVFREGTVIDCRDGTLWPAESYFKHYVADPTTLLVNA